MSKVKYKTYLSSKSMRHTAKLIRDYQKRLEKQIEQFCEELAKAGEMVIRADLATHNSGDGDTLGSVKLVTEGSGHYGYYKAKVQVTSDAILFIEFGSGINHSTITAPHAAEHGMGVGTYPSEAKWQNPDFPNWANPDGWHYYGSDGKLHWSDGMYPTYPMYKGGREMEEKLETIAKKVFG